jgi:NAD(P)-dependent dehydrogenase (short-subunit alcohol dehydrogenase family)
LKISAAQLEAMGAEVLQHVPTRRFGKADEVAQVIAFLASAAASYVNGAEYTVGGGMEA